MANGIKQFPKAKILFISALCITLFFVLNFFVAQLYEAAHKPFWGDERFGLNVTLQSRSYLEMIILGASGQGSPAPLDYIISKFLVQIKDQVSSFGLGPLVYFRLVANISTAIGILIIFLFFATQILRDKNKFTLGSQLLLLSIVPMSFLFCQNVYYYAAEARPYAIWNTMYLLSLAIVFWGKKYRWGLVVALIGLALSATTSIFQILCMLIAFLIVEGIGQKNKKVLVFDAIRIFGFPLLVSYYYCSKVGDWGIQTTANSFPEYFKMWQHEAGVTIPLMVGAIGLCMINVESREFSIAPLAFLLVFLLGPGIFYVTKLKGYFYADRQYIYYDLTNVVFLLTLVRLLPYLLVRKLGVLGNSIILLLVFVVAFSVAFRPKATKKFSSAVMKTLQVIREPSIVRNN